MPCLHSSIDTVSASLNLENNVDIQDINHLGDYLQSSQLLLTSQLLILNSYHILNKNKIYIPTNSLELFDTLQQALNLRFDTYKFYLFEILSTNLRVKFIPLYKEPQVIQNNKGLAFYNKWAQNQQFYNTDLKNFNSPIFRVMSLYFYGYEH